MPTATDPHLRPVAPFEPYAGDPKQDAALHPNPARQYADTWVGVVRHPDGAIDPNPGPPLADEPGPGPVMDPSWSTERLSPGAQVLHAYACACDWGAWVDGHHGDDFEANAARHREAILTDAIAKGEVAPAPVTYPTAPKVWAGTWGALGASLAVVLLQAVLDHLDLIPGLLGGNPYAGVLVIVLMAVLPPTIQHIQAWRAQHQVRAVDKATK